ncbi:DUF262 domain-containing protein [Priestia megaterium]|uniref:DUF262 domain-containing protein n=1 Tax=Priestia megaterium TaxID=1404 RepID=UPI00300AC677
MTNRKIDLIKNETRDVKWFIDKMRNGELIVDNSFQRKYVWHRKHQVSLIETILLGYTIPEIYLWNVGTDPETGQTTYSIVDGQQRLGAVLDFISGDIALERNYIDQKDNSYSNKAFRELGNEEKSAIWEYPFSTRFIKREVIREDIIEMFLRLNSTNNSLNPQELRNAEFNGEFLKLAEQLATNSFWTDYDIFSPTQIRRMGDIQFISSLLIFLRFGIEEETTQTNINKIYDMFNDYYEEKDEDKENFDQIIEMIRSIMIDEQIIKFVSKTTHLYILFIICYLMQKTGKSFRGEILYRFKAFVESYDSETELQRKYSFKEAVAIIEYKKLSSEGTQSKSKRIRRLEIMRGILGL